MSGCGKITVLVCHSDPLVEAGLRATLGCVSDLDVRCPVASTGARPPMDEVAEASLFDVVVTDFAQGIALTRRLVPIARGLAAPKILIVTGGDAEWQIRGALERGVQGYLLAGCDLGEFSAAVRVVSRGARYLDSKAAARLVDSMLLEPLTPREEEVLRFVCQGLCNKSIGRQLGIAVETVKSRLKSVFEKLGVENRTQAAAVAAQRGLSREWDRTSLSRAAPGHRTVDQAIAG